MKIVEVRRLANVSRLRLPFVNVAASAGNLVPKRVLFCEVAVKSAVSLWIESLTHQAVDLFHRRPDVAQVNLTVVAVAEGICREVEIDTSSDCKRDDERRTHQKVRLDTLVYACLEVSIPR